MFHFSRSCLNGVAADEQSAAGGFQKMKLARFNAPEDVAGCRTRERGGLAWREHENFSRALLAPDCRSGAQANRCSLPPLNRDFGFGLRSSHLVEFGGREKSIPANVPGDFRFHYAEHFGGKAFRKSLI